MFIGIGGTLWELKSTISELVTSVKVMAVTVNRTSGSLDRHMIDAERLHTEMERRVDKIEQGETFFNFYDKNNQRIPKK